MIDEKEISIRWHSGTGAGGQHRNRTQNCCEITHLPSGFKAVGTESRSRQDNKKTALEFNCSFERYFKNTFEDEMADILIRVLDLCCQRGIDIEEHVRLKMKYNSLRPYKHGKKY